MTFVICYGISILFYPFNNVLHMLQVWSVCHFFSVFESCRGCWIWKDDWGAGSNAAHNPSRSVKNAIIIASHCAINILWSLEGDISMFCPCIGKDVLAKAKTGTGKTVAFLVLLLALQLVDLMSLAPTELLQSHYLAVTQSDWVFTFVSASSYWGSLHIASPTESVTTTYKFAGDVSY